MIRTTELSELRKSLGERPPAALVCRRSFESRACSLATALYDAGLAPQTTYLIESDDRSYVDDCWHGIANLIRIGVSTRQPEVTFRALRDLVQSLSICDRGDGWGPLLVDITAFRREELLQLFALLCRLNSRPDNFQLAYVPAEVYAETWLSRGAAGFRSIIGFPGEILPSRPNHLVLMIGFELDRARSMIENYEPSHISLGYAAESGSLSSAFHKRNRDVFNSFLQTIAQEARSSFVFSAKDPLEAASNLAAALDQHPGYNHVIAPLNNKIATLGAGLLALRRPEVQLCYASPIEYNVDEYTSPSTKAVLIESSDLHGWSRSQGERPE